MKKVKRLPDILTTAELESLFEASKNLKIKAVLMTSYSSGLRCSEVIRLKVHDIDSKKMQLHIRQAKGQKDRFTILSERNCIASGSTTDSIALATGCFIPRVIRPNILLIEWCRSI